MGRWQKRGGAPLPSCGTGGSDGLRECQRRFRLDPPSLRVISTPASTRASVPLSLASKDPSEGLSVRPEGLEPPTPGSEGRCSIQLSYGRRPKALFLQSLRLGEFRRLGRCETPGLSSHRWRSCRSAPLWALAGYSRVLPVSYRPCATCRLSGRSDGARTRNPWDHNPVR